MYLFGSWARGEQKRSSDIDVAIEFTASETDNHLAKIRMALEESTIPYRVDVVHLNEADDVIAKKVMAEGILWEELQKDSGRQEGIGSLSGSHAIRTAWPH